MKKKRIIIIRGRMNSSREQYELQGKNKKGLLIHANKIKEQC